MTPAEKPAISLPCGNDAGAPQLDLATERDLERVVEIQFAAYARNRELLGVEPLPLMVDYQEIFATHEVWLYRTESDRIVAALILELRRDDLLIFSVATDPDYQSSRIGRHLLSAADIRARQLGHQCVRLYTGSTLQHLVEWYGRHGFAIEQIEQLDDRAITHMVKNLT